MYLPDYVSRCIQALEEAGFAAYAVGGCVRDACLGLTPHDYDLCTAALPEQTEAVFAGEKLVLAGKKHGTVGVVTDGGVVEITTFRTEGDYLDNRHPEWVEFVSEIEKDLARRDFTVNAMAYSPSRGFADPFGGREDLANKVLRAVGDPAARFQEDSLRILRGVRFAVKYSLKPEEITESAMISLAPLMDNLARERVFDELCRLLPLVTADDLLRFAPVLGAVILELQPTFGFDQKCRHHAYDLFTHIARVAENVPADLSLRWAALLHDVGKPGCFTLDEQGQGHFYGHAQVSAELADSILRRLKAPTTLRERVVFLIDKHMTPLEADRKLLRRRLAQYGAEATEQLLALQIADTDATGVSSGGERFAGVGEILAQLQAEDACLTVRDLAIDGHDLMALGITGRQIGITQKRLLELVLEERIPNEKEALLNFAMEELI